jgi:mRNA-degrading endonuclease RelE of RelBE toxin-antitoxin system
MIFTVVWTPSADDELADIWNNAPDQQAVADAANRIERELRSRPLDKVQHVHEGLYVYLVKPLLVVCEVESDDRIVLIVQVRRV